jgi:hypothetical protein
MPQQQCGKAMPFRPRLFLIVEAMPRQDRNGGAASQVLKNQVPVRQSLTALGCGKAAV